MQGRSLLPLFRPGVNENGAQTRLKKMKAELARLLKETGAPQEKRE